MISASNLSKNYGTRQALSKLSFEVNRGEVVGFLGPNGAGKTTTMKILTGYMTPSEGSVFIDGVDVFKQPKLAKKKLGYLPEQAPLYTDMYVKDYLTYVAQLKLCDTNLIPQLVDEACSKTGLSDVKTRLISNLSKGFKQRVGLAQALVSRPDILILDEPTVGLDPRQVREIRSLLSQLKGRHTIILSSHILSEIKASCDRVIIINKGQLVKTSPIEQLVDGLEIKKELFIKVRKNQGLKEKLQAVSSDLEVIESPDHFVVKHSGSQAINEQIAESIVSGGFGLLEMKEQSLDLENAFINLTKQD